MSVRRGNAFECRWPEFRLLANLFERNRSALVVAVGTRVRPCRHVRSCLSAIEFTQKPRHLLRQTCDPRQDPPRTLTVLPHKCFCPPPRRVPGTFGLRSNGHYQSKNTI